MKRAERKLSWWLAGVVLAVGVAVLAVVPACHGHIIRRDFVPNHQRDFDFTHPPCEPAPRPDAETDQPLIRYFRVSGLYVEWKGMAVLAAPFFSNYGLFRAGFGSLDWNEEAIRRGMQGLPQIPIRAVLVGHSHYDHIGDLPPILRDHAADADVFVSRSGRHMLERCGETANRFVDLDANLARWVRPGADDGTPAPFRIMPLISGHADHFAGYHYARGEVTETWDCMKGKRIKSLKEGRPYAFLIDLLADDGSVAFRIHYQDAVSQPPLGLPPPEVIAEHAVDVAVLCMPSYWRVERYPEALLERSRARHVLVTHYEDFFRSTAKPLRFVAMLTDGRANEFLRRVELEMARPAHRAAGPDSPVCGPSGEAWTMPLPGEWMRFRSAAP